MAGFPLGSGGGGGHRGARDQPPVTTTNPGSEPGSSSAAAAFLYASAGAAPRGGFQLWQNPPHQHQFYGGGAGASSIIRFADDPAVAGSSSSRGRGGSGSGTISCQDCGNQAKKDCPHMRCRTCCKSRGFDCATHVKSTWVPAARRRDRHSQPAAGAAPEPFKRPRDAIAAAGQPSSTTPTTTSSGGEQQMERFPREVSSEAVFRCVRLGGVDAEGADAEVAYQTTVSIGGHVFKGILHDLGPDTSLAQHHRAEGSSPPSTAASGGAAVSSSAVVMDPYPTPGPYGSYGGGGAPFFHGHHTR